MNRRKSIKALALGAVTPGLLVQQNRESRKGGIPAGMLPDSGNLPTPAEQTFTSRWEDWPDMDWAGPEFWGNRLQDWRVRQGRVECVVQEENRSLHWLTCQLKDSPESFATAITLLPAADLPASVQNYAGFRLGAKGKFADYRSAAVYGQGLEAGVTTEGQLFIGKERGPEKVDLQGGVRLRLEAVPEGENYRLLLTASDPAGNRPLARLTATGIPGQQLAGNIALLAHAGQKRPAVRATSPAGGRSTEEKTAFTFGDWELTGPKVVYQPGQSFGPVCFAQYTLHGQTLRLTAQLAPVEKIGGHQVRLQVQENGGWKTIGQATAEAFARTARFRQDNWSASRAVPYRVLVELPLKSGVREYAYEGTVAAEPRGANQLKVAVFSCNADYGFPDADVAPRVAVHKPDMAVFLGDQFYESTGGFGVETSPPERAALDYLRKWYMFGWSYREVFRHLPAAFIPDDHDVYHGNVWGEGGKHAPTDQGWAYVAQDQGGYKMPPQWVNLVQLTQTSHLPAPYDPTPAKQGIGVYYTNWNYGGVSFAILEDRKFKSAPKNVLPEEAKVQNGFIQNPDFDIRKHRDIKAELLGARQLKFLEDWATDWKDGVEMKAVLSQTNFCTVATLPKGSIIDEAVPRLPIPEPGEYVSGDAPTVDMDSNGWPQKGRDEALRKIRKAFAFHIAGDQHLASTVQYGVDAYGDAGYAFAGPALNNLWPRRWWPDRSGHQPLPGKAAYTGDFLDGFGNRMTVHAVANPRKTGHEPALIHDRATGYGIVVFDKENRTIRTECWPRYVDPRQNPDGQYAGWPITVKQLDNYGRKAVAWLPEIRVQGLEHPVVEVIAESSGQLLYCLRIRGNTFRPKVFAEGKYTVVVSDPDKGIRKEQKGVAATRAAKGSLLITV